MSLNRNIYEEQNQNNINDPNLTKNKEEINKDEQLVVREGISCLGNSSIMDKNQNLNNNLNTIVQ